MASSNPTPTTPTTTAAMDTRTRIAAALQGAFVADAACMGTHWIYDPREMKAAVPSVEAPEFPTPPTPRYYSSSEFPGHYGPGMSSPYGEQMWFATHFCATHRGDIKPAEMSAALKTWAETFGGRPDGATKDFLANANKGKGWEACGANDNQAHCFMKAVPVTCLFAGRPELLIKVEEAVRVHQNNDEAVAFGKAAAIILEAAILGSSLSGALQKCRIWAESRHGHAAVVSALDRGQNEAKQSTTSLESLMQALSSENLGGRSCHMPAAFIVPIYQLTKISLAAGGEDSLKSEETYIQAVRDNILAAGDTCSRVVFTASVLAAWIGSVPTSFSSRMDTATWNKVQDAAASIARESVRPGTTRSSF